MSLIFISTGRVSLGRNRVDNAGNIIESSPAQFEFAEDGPCVAVGELDPETMEVKGDPYLYGNWDAAGYLAEAMKRLHPARQINIPDFKAIVRDLWEEEKIDVCHYCQKFGCGDCIVKEWKEEDEE